MDADVKWVLHKYCDKVLVSLTKYYPKVLSLSSKLEVPCCLLT
jgi:hypothetical protein